nr:methyltransferase [Clavibacter sepedonicus]
MTGGGRANARARAQRWFTDPELTPVSSAFDARESAASRDLSIGALVARHRAVHGRPPSTLLDVSCGAGELLATAAELLPGCRLLGIDISESAVARARERVPGADIRVGAAEEAAAYDAWPPLDAVMVHLSLGLWRDPSAGLARIVERLAADATLATVDIGRGGGSEPDDPLSAAYLRDQREASFTVGELRGLLRDAAPGARITVGTTGLAGLDATAPEIPAMLGDPAFLTMIRSAGARAASRGPSPEVLHGWVDVHGAPDGRRPATTLRPLPPRAASTSGGSPDAGRSAQARSGLAPPPARRGRPARDADTTESISPGSMTRLMATCAMATGNSVRSARR